MTTQFPTATDEQLLEFYLCGMRTGFPTAKDAKAKHVNSDIIQCIYCPSFHVSPHHENKHEAVEEANKAFAKLIESLNENSTVI